MAPAIGASCCGIMIGLRCRAEFSTTGVFARFWLPWGRPGWAWLAEPRLWALARAAAVAASVRRRCATRIGYERRSLTLSQDKVQKASPGTG